MEPRVEKISVAISKLWIDGVLVSAPGAVLEPADGGWSVLARLPSHSPFARPYGLSMQTADGRTAHGRAALVSAQGEDLVFRLAGPLRGTL